ncbi:MAG: hypothetical protein KGS48_02095 [Bacteroidetes bacterium]|nr:hypothetical protein [Bacteroidota bacterium]
MKPKSPYRLTLKQFWTEWRKPIDWLSPDDELADFDRRFMRILHRHLVFLGWWSVLCLLGSAFALCLITGFWYYFLMMNCVWGAINFGITLMLVHHALFKKFRPGDTFERFQIQRHVQQFMYLNIGIDVAYLFAGFWIYSLQTCAAHPIQALWAGFGAAIVLQAVYLGAQDIWVTSLHEKNFRQAEPYLRQIVPPSLATEN